MRSSSASPAPSTAPASLPPPTDTVPDPAAKFPVLISYAFLRTQPPERIEWILGNPHVEVLLDSGAFSALNAGTEILLPEYLAFLERWRDRLFGYIALDKLGDPRQTDLNLREMIAAGFRPLPVHVRGDDGARMDALFELSPWVALGGLRRPKRGPASPAYVKQKMLWARGRRVHWLGYTRLDHVGAFRPYSADCSSFARGAMYGRCDFYLGHGRWSKWSRQKMREGKALSREEVALLEGLGFEEKDFRNEHLWHAATKHGIPRPRFLTEQVTTSSWVRYVREVRATLGTRIFVAVILVGLDVEEVYHYVNLTRAGGDWYPNPAFDGGAANA